MSRVYLTSYLTAAITGHDALPAHLPTNLEVYYVVSNTI